MLGNPIFNSEISAVKSIVEELRLRAINTEMKVNFLLERELPLGSNLAPQSGQEKWGSRTFAQHGDDIISLAILDGLGILKPFYVDIGAHHPFNISNSALMYTLGFRGVNIEPNPVLFEAFPTQRPEDINLNVGVSGTSGTLEFYMFEDRSGLNTFDRNRVEFIEKTTSFRVSKILNIPVLTYQDIQEKYFPGKTPDFISLDVEGLDTTILASMNLAKHRPALICVEANSKVEAESIGSVMSMNKYSLAFKSVVNLFFVDSTKFNHWS